jgi:hypothetical protein
VNAARFTPLPPVNVGDELLTQSEAAKLLKVSVSYLRASDCPKILLPSAGGKRPLVRYRKSALLAWATHWEVSVTEGAAHAA